MDEIEFEKSLIAFVEARPFLYDIKNKSYKNKNQKNLEFQDFASTCGKSGRVKIIIAISSY